MKLFNHHLLALVPLLSVLSLAPFHQPDVSLSRGPASTKKSKAAPKKKKEDLKKELAEKSAELVKLQQEVAELKAEKALRDEDPMIQAHKENMEALLLAINSDKTLSEEQEEKLKENFWKQFNKIVDKDDQEETLKEDFWKKKFHVTEKSQEDKEEALKEDFWKNKFHVAEKSQEDKEEDLKDDFWKEFHSKKKSKHADDEEDCEHTKVLSEQMENLMKQNAIITKAFGVLSQAVQAQQTQMGLMMNLMAADHRHQSLYQYASPTSQGIWQYIPTGNQSGNIFGNYQGFDLQNQMANLQTPAMAPQGYNGWSIKPSNFMGPLQEHERYATADGIGFNFGNSMAQRLNYIGPVMTRNF